mmetsp:Transcript_10869/g.25478  ORF Transcript_10869/g.25478 Transcript_10869/m.25478 type:complete len:210 (+) Transcript_10869:660-1289(+)
MLLGVELDPRAVRHREELPPEIHDGLDHHVSPRLLLVRFAQEAVLWAASREVSENRSCLRHCSAVGVNEVWEVGERESLPLKGNFGFVPHALVKCGRIPNLILPVLKRHPHIRKHDADRLAQCPRPPVAEYHPLFCHICSATIRRSCFLSDLELAGVFSIGAFRVQGKPRISGDRLKKETGNVDAGVAQGSSRLVLFGNKGSQEYQETD